MGVETDFPAEGGPGAEQGRPWGGGREALGRRKGGEALMAEGTSMDVGPGYHNTKGVRHSLRSLLYPARSVSWDQLL